MKFFTLKWDLFINEYYKDALPIHMSLIDIMNSDVIDEKDYEKNHDLLFNKYYNLKKKYTDSKDELLNKFEYIEEVDLNDKEKELSEFNKRIEDYVDNFYNAIEAYVNYVYENNKELITFDEEDVRFLAINIVTKI